MRFFISILNYSHIYIGICAWSLTTFTSWNLQQDMDFQTYPFLVFFATVSLYSMHRIIGLRKMKESYYEKTRYEQIARLKSLILVSFALSIVCSILMLFFISFSLLLALLPAVLLSIAYTLPIFPKNQRLRDYPFIKILIIAIVWAIITAWIPASQLETPTSLKLTLFLERFFFIWAITIPFDIRDYHLDRLNQVKTIPGIYGIENAKILAYVLCILTGFFAYLNSLTHDGMYLIIWIITLMFTYIGIRFSLEKRSDYYYSFLIDGLMIVPLLLTIFNGILSNS